MQDQELYRRILGIEAPWQVERVELKLEQGEVHVYLEHEAKREWACAECGTVCPLYDHQGERQWRHLDTCQYRTILHAAPPRSQCPEHGVRVVKLPWAEANSRFTALMEGIAIAWLRQASQKAVAEQLHLSWDEIHGIMERAVERGLGRRKTEKIAYLGVDEKAFRKGHKYFTLVNDLSGHRVLYVAEDREQKSLDGFWPTLTEKQRNSIAAVAMDMWDPYVNPGGVDCSMDHAASDRTRFPGEIEDWRMVFKTQANDSFVRAISYRQSGVVPAGTGRDGSRIEPRQYRPAPKI